MKRALAIAVAALAAGCTSSEPIYGDLTLYWDFERHLLVSPGSRIYDANVNPGGASRACPESGVDEIDILDYASGQPLDPTSVAIPCIFAGVQGATVPRLPAGTYDLLFRGWRNGVAAPLFERRASAVVRGGVDNPYDVRLSGIEDDLDVFLYDGANPFTCVAGDTIDYTLVDGIGTVVDQITVLPCGNPIQFRVASQTGIDRDTLDIRVLVYDAGSTLVFDSCVSQPFGHHGADVLGSGWSVALQARPTGFPCP